MCVWIHRHMHEAQRIRKSDAFIVRIWEVTPLPQPHRQKSTAPPSFCGSRVKETWHRKGGSYHTGTLHAFTFRLRLYKTQQWSSGLKLQKLIWTEEQSHAKKTQLKQRKPEITQKLEEGKESRSRRRSRPINIAFIPEEVLCFSTHPMSSWLSYLE